MQVQVKASEPNIGKLLKQKRIKVDENGDVIGNPKNPVEGTIRRRVTRPNDRTGALESTVVELPRNAGHAKGPDGVWRVAMCKPTMFIGKFKIDASCPQEMYHKMTLLLEDLKKMGKGRDDFRPELEPEEWKSYQEWLSKQKKEKKAE